MPNWENCMNLEDFEILRVIENLLLKQSTLGQHRESVATNFLNHQRCKKCHLFQEINNFSKFILETIFLILEYCGQNQVSGLHPKKSGVIFFQPKLLDPKQEFF